MADSAVEASGKLFEYGVRKAVVLHFPEGACEFTADGIERRQGSFNMPSDAIRVRRGRGMHSPRVFCSRFTMDVTGTKLCVTVFAQLQVR